MLQEKLLPLMINPYTGNKLNLQDDVLIDELTGESFEIKDGVPVMLRSEEVTGLNLTYQRRYDWLCYFYDFLADVVAPLFGADKVFEEIAEIMDVGNSDWVLETSIGTGKQIANLLDHGKAAEFIVGLDISYGMLRRCRRNARRWNASLQLIQGNAETLPFQNEVFDVVFHIGGINFFEDKESAVLEMIRVAKPGARLYIGDETEKLLEEQPSIVNRYYQDPGGDIYAAPLEYVPKHMLDVTSHTLFDGKMYLISFEKPNSSEREAEVGDP